MAAGLVGCDFLQGGLVKQPAQYTLPKGKHVLVLVEAREGVAAPPAFATTLADQIGGALWQKKVVDAPPVPQEKLIGVQQADPEAYKRKGIADIAQETGADVVVRVYVTQLLAVMTEDGNVAEGNAEAYVKVVDRQGSRLWPGDVTGTKVTAHVDMGLTADRSTAEILKNLEGQLGDQTERMFHEYTPEKHNEPMH